MYGQTQDVGLYICVGSSDSRIVAGMQIFTSYLTHRLEHLSWQCRWVVFRKHIVGATITTNYCDGHV
jgi:hypothetical protein